MHTEKLIKTSHVDPPVIQARTGRTNSRRLVEKLSECSCQPTQNVPRQARTGHRTGDLSASGSVRGPHGVRKRCTGFASTISVAEIGHLSIRAEVARDTAQHCQPTTQLSGGRSDGRRWVESRSAARSLSTSMGVESPTAAAAMRRAAAPK